MEGQNGLHNGSIDGSTTSPSKVHQDSSQGVPNGSIARRKHTVPESDSDLSEAETIISSPIKKESLDPLRERPAISSTSFGVSPEPPLMDGQPDKKIAQLSRSESAETSDSGEKRARGYARKKRRKNVEGSLPRSDNESTNRHSDWSKNVVGKKRSGKDANGRGKLQRACDKGHYEDAKQLIEEGADVNAQDYAGNTPLHEAALNGHDQIVEMLLQNHARVDIRSGPDDLDTPLIDASANGNIESVKILLQYGADPRLRNAHGLDALDSVGEDLDSHEEISDTLRQALADTRKTKSDCDGSNSPTSDNLIRSESSLLASRQAGRRRGVRAQATREDLLWIDLTSRSGRELVYQRAAEGDMEYVGSFLEGGWKPDADILALAARHGHADLLGLLLAFGAPVNGINENGETALLSAAGRRRPDILKLLLESGADPFAKDPEGKNSLDIARERIGSDVEEAKVLLQAMSQNNIKVEPTDFDKGSDLLKKRKAHSSSARKDLKPDGHSSDISKPRVNFFKADAFDTKKVKALASNMDHPTPSPKLHKRDKSLPHQAKHSATEESSPNEVKSSDSSPNGIRKQLKHSSSRDLSPDHERVKKKVAPLPSDIKGSSKDEEIKAKGPGLTSEKESPVTYSVSKGTLGDGVLNSQNHQKPQVRLSKVDKSRLPLINRDSHKIFKQPQFAVRVGNTTTGTPTTTSARIFKDKSDDNNKPISSEEPSPEVSVPEQDLKPDNTESSIIHNSEQPEKEVSKGDTITLVEHPSPTTESHEDQEKTADNQLHRKESESVVPVSGPLYVIRIPKHYNVFTDTNEKPEEYITDLQMNILIKNFKGEIGNALDPIERIVCQKEDQPKLWTPLSCYMLEPLPRFSSLPVETLIHHRREKAENVKNLFMQQTVSFMKLDKVLEALSNSCVPAYEALKHRSKVEIDLDYVYGSVPDALPSKDNNEVLGKIVGAGTLVRQQFGAVNVEKLPLRVRFKLKKLGQCRTGDT